MNRRKAIGSMVAGAAATAATTRVASAASTEIEILVEHWKKSKDLTLKTAEAMPAEFYDFNLSPKHAHLALNSSTWARPKASTWAD